MERTNRIGCARSSAYGSFAKDARRLRLCIGGGQSDQVKTLGEIRSKSMRHANLWTETQTNSANVKMSICGRVDLVQQFYVASHLKDDGGERCLHTMNEVVPNLIDLMQDMTAPRSYVLFDSYPFIMTMSSPKPHDEGSIHGKQNVIWIPPVYDIPAGCSNACLLDNSRRDGLPCALMIKQADLVAFVVAGIRRKAVMASLRGRVEPSLVALMRARKQT